MKPRENLENKVVWYENLLEEIRQHLVKNKKISPRDGWENLPDAIQRLVDWQGTET